MKTILIAVIFLALAISGIAVKMFFKKGATFQRHCSSENAEKDENCACRGDEKNCRYRTVHHPIEDILDDE